MPLIFDIRRFSVHDGPGIRTTLFFKGCPMQCPWCHNPESRRSEAECITRRNVIDEKTFEVVETIGKQYNTEELMKEILRDLPFYEESMGGVTFSGGEPLSQAEDLMSLLMDCRKHSIHTAIDTSGFAPQKVFAEIAQYADLFLFDIKFADNQKHIEYSGVSNDIILDNLFYLLKINKPVIIRIPLIPGVNTGFENLKGTLQILNRIKSIVMRVDLLPYHKLGIGKYQSLGMESVVYPELSDELLNLWKKELTKEGFNNIVGG